MSDGVEIQVLAPQCQFCRERYLWTFNDVSCP